MEETTNTPKKTKRYSVHNVEKLLLRTDEIAEAHGKIAELKAENDTYIRLNDRETGHQIIWRKSVNDKNYIVTNIPKKKKNE